MLPYDSATYQHNDGETSEQQPHGFSVFLLRRDMDVTRAYGHDQEQSDDDKRPHPYLPNWVL